MHLTQTGADNNTLRWFPVRIGLKELHDGGEILNRVLERRSAERPRSPPRQYLAGYTRSRLTVLDSLSLVKNDYVPAMPPRA
jgi:hypothetical protein